MKSKQVICQSCGMPMIIDEDFGTNNDGSKNDEYCYHCYAWGGFVLPGISKNQMIERLVDMAEEMGVNKEEARKMVSETIPKLKRWK